MSLSDNKENLPDITLEQKPAYFSKLNRVGMSDIVIPVQLFNEETGKQYLPAKASITVSLDKQGVKGIHMSRLYILLCDYLKEKLCTPTHLESLLDQLIQSQQGISSSCYLELEFKYLLYKKSLVSQLSGPQYYPIKFSMKKERERPAEFCLNFSFYYSSTCPCSGRLSESYIQKSMALQQAGLEHGSSSQNSSEKNSIPILKAVPHAQRSQAEITLCFSKIPENLNLNKLILDTESCIATPVQSVVKREDELEFARLNAENMIFCEDAARLIKKHYDAHETSFSDYTIKVVHFESLHAHNTLAIARKNN